jgi:hypothetical protein
MYVVGKALDLEYALRGLAKATTKGGYLLHMVERKDKALASLKNIANLIDNAEIKKIIELADGMAVQVNNSGYLIVADQIGLLNKTFSTLTNDVQLNALDSLLPKPEDYKGKVYHP